MKPLIENRAVRPEPPTSRGQKTSEDPLDTLVNLAKAAGDRLRAGILQVLHQESYSVGELCALFAVPQPALSHHLKILHTSGLVARRREGNSIFYRRASLPAGSTAAALLEGLDAAAMDPQLNARVEDIHQQRNRRSAEFFASNAAEINAQQAEICEPANYADVVMEMVETALAEGLPAGHVLEVGPGDGHLLARLSEHFETVTGVDNSRTMLRAARAALTDQPRIRLRHQDFLALPAQRRYDALVAAMVVHHQASPATFFRQAAAVLHKNGELVVAELCHHDQQWATDVCGDLWLGFEPEELTGWATRAGFLAPRSQYLALKNGFRVQIHRFQLDS